MSDTPRTDAQISWKGNTTTFVCIGFARDLERELAEANARLDFLSELFNKKWNGVLGKGSKSYYELRGDWRHIVQSFEGKTLADAIDAAMKERK